MSYKSTAFNAKDSLIIYAFRWDGFFLITLQGWYYVKLASIWAVNVK